MTWRLDGPPFGAGPERALHRRPRRARHPPRTSRRTAGSGRSTLPRRSRQARSSTSSRSSRTRAGAPHRAGPTAARGDADGAVVPGDRARRAWASSSSAASPTRTSTTTRTPATWPTATGRGSATIASRLAEQGRTDQARDAARPRRRRCPTRRPSRPASASLYTLADAYRARRRHGGRRSPDARASAEAPALWRPAGGRVDSGAASEQAVPVRAVSSSRAYVLGERAPTAASAFIGPHRRRRSRTTPSAAPPDDDPPRAAEASASRPPRRRTAGAVIGRRRRILPPPPPRCPHSSPTPTSTAPPPRSASTAERSGRRPHVRLALADADSGRRLAVEVVRTRQRRHVVKVYGTEAHLELHDCAGRRHVRRPGRGDLLRPRGRARRRPGRRARAAACSLYANVAERLLSADFLDGRARGGAGGRRALDVRAALRGRSGRPRCEPERRAVSAGGGAGRAGDPRRPRHRRLDEADVAPSSRPSAPVRASGSQA